MSEMRDRYNDARRNGHSRFHAFLWCVPPGPFFLACAGIGILVGIFL